jgi:beta-glucosidase
MSRDRDEMTDVDRQQSSTGLSVHQKARLTAGTGMWSLPDEPDLALLPITVSDGPNGVRGSRMDERFTGYCTPCGTSLAATWNTATVGAIGELVARDAHRQGVQVVLGPTVNLHRSPLGGRGFECYSEDPQLTADIGVAWVRGLQGLGVAATPKHFVANDSETSRRSVNAVVDQRALRELYLAPFEALAEAGAWSMMTAYNKVNGHYAAAHRELVLELLKGEWGWDGLVMSDWFGAVETVASAVSGLDLEMPGPARVFGEALAAAVEAGDVPADVLDDKVERLLRLARRIGRLSDSTPVTVELRDDQAERAVLRRTAAEGFVLLRNDQGLLPLADVDGRKIAVIGTHAQIPCFHGGGSASLAMNRPVTPLAALRRRFADATLTYEPGCLVREALPSAHTLDIRPTHAPEGRSRRVELTEAPDLQSGAVTVEYFDADAVDAGPYLRETRASTRLTWLGDFPTDGRDLKRALVRVSGYFTTTVAGHHDFSVRGSGKITLRVDGDEVLSVPDRIDKSDVFSLLFGNDEDREGAELNPGEHLLSAEAQVEPAALVALHIGARPPVNDDMFDRAVRSAAEADVALVFVGTTDEIETESQDRSTIQLPGRQVDVARAIAAVCPNTVVVVNAGMPVDLSWAEDVPAVVYAWFPGQEFGDALADVLSGDVEPGGRLPMTLAKTGSDYPAYMIDPGPEKQLDYVESVHIGYRHFDAKGIEPAYCFGHGLGYTDFAYDSIAVTDDGGGSGAVTVRVTVRNVGSRPGKEVVQLYVAPPAGTAAVPRPPQELASFAVVELDAGAEAAVELTLRPRDFAYWDVDVDRWRQEAGEYTVRVGRSSRDVRLTAPVDRAGQVL